MQPAKRTRPGLYATPPTDTASGGSTVAPPALSDATSSGFVVWSWREGEKKRGPRKSQRLVAKVYFRYHSDIYRLSLWYRNASAGYRYGIAMESRARFGYRYGIAMESRARFGYR